MKDITTLTKKEMTHGMIFDLWFQVNVNQYNKKVFKAWAKVIMYSEKGYSLDGKVWMSKDELLALEYAIIPKE